MLPWAVSEENVLLHGQTLRIGMLARLISKYVKFQLPGPLSSDWLNDVGSFAHLNSIFLFYKIEKLLKMGHDEGAWLLHLD